MKALLKNKWIVIGAALVALLIIGITTSKTQKKAPIDAFKSNLESNYLRINDAVEAAVKQQLKYPEEAQFDTNEGYTVVDLSSNKAGTRGYVMAKNALGVKSKMRYEAVFVLNDNKVNVERVNLQQ